MVNFTSKKHQIKRDFNFSNKISRKLRKSDRKFMTDMNYGILASNSCLLTDIVDQLHEPFKKINSVERLSRHLPKGTPKKRFERLLSLYKIFKVLWSSFFVTSRPNFCHRGHATP